jgi:hypothetical protein
MIEFEIVAQGLYRPDQLSITYKPALRMPMTPTIQAWMNDVWEQKLAIAKQKNVPLFDAPLFRLIDVHTGKHPANAASAASATHSGRMKGSASADHLYLTLGDTGYKEYVTTRTPEFAQKHTRSELSNALGVCYSTSAKALMSM